MPTFVTTCRACGKEHEPDQTSIRIGAWNRCPACAPKPAEHGHCRECGRVLRDSGRTVCLSCAGLSPL